MLVLFFFSLSQMTTASDNITKFKQFDQYDFDKDNQFQVCISIYSIDMYY